MNFLASKHKLSQIPRAWRKTCAATLDAPFPQGGLDTVFAGIIIYSSKVLLGNQTDVSRVPRHTPSGPHPHSPHHHHPTPNTPHPLPTPKLCVADSRLEHIPTCRADQPQL